MYSASVVDNATHACFLLCHETKLDPSKWHVPLVLFLSILQPAKSESKYPTKLRETSAGYHSPTVVVPYRYFRILYAAVKCDSLGLDWNLAQEHKGFYIGSPTKRATSSPSHTVRISLKMINWSSLQHFPTARIHCTRSNHCWTYSRPRNHTESTMCSKNSLAETHSKPQLYRIHCITQKRLTAHRNRPLLNLQQNKKLHRNPLCVSRTPCWHLQVTVIQKPLYNQEPPHTAPRSRRTTSTVSLYHELHPSNSRTQ